MRIRIAPSKASGAVAAPPSKSMAHRLLICAGLSEGESIVRRLAFSEDVKATISCLRALGADIRIEGDTAFVRGTDVIKPRGKAAVLNCGECGSTLRFFTALCMLSGEERALEGTPYLMSRPMSVYEDIARAEGIRFEKDSERLTVQGKLSGGRYAVRGDISSQFISGLLFALPLLDSDSELELIPPVESRPYIGMTTAALREFGIEIVETGNKYFIRGGQSYRAADVTVEGDWSNAAFFEALNYAGSNVTVEGLKRDSLQGDRIYKILFEKIKNHNGDIDISDCPDLGPVLFCAAALCGGARFTGTARLRIKESDRAEAMRSELMKFGIAVSVSENEVIVSGGELRPPSEALFGHSDHRIVMSLAILSTVTGGVIDGAQAVAKSFPDFFDKLSTLGVELEYELD